MCDVIVWSRETGEMCSCRHPRARHLESWTPPFDTCLDCDCRRFRPADRRGRLCSAECDAAV